MIEQVAHWQLCKIFNAVCCNEWINDFSFHVSSALIIQGASLLVLSFKNIFKTRIRTQELISNNLNGECCAFSLFKKEEEILPPVYPLCAIKKQSGCLLWVSNQQRERASEIWQRHLLCQLGNAHAKLNRHLQTGLVCILCTKVVMIFAIIVK